VAGHAVGIAVGTEGQGRSWPRPRGEGWAGALAMAPMVAGLAPFALVLGAAIADHATPVAGWAGIWPIFSGSAHLIVLRVVDDGGGAPLAIASGLLVNARLAVYSASLAPRWRDQPRWFRVVAAALLIDPTWALAEERASRSGSAADHRRYYLGAGLTLAVGWATMVTAAMAVGDRAGGASGLDLAVPLCLVALMGPRLRRPTDATVVATAGLVAAMTAEWPPGTGILVSIGAAIAVGGLTGGGRR
jgi:predicted branched-subunit amino acid permease